jgi:hypothetical protein
MSDYQLLKNDSTESIRWTVSQFFRRSGSNLQISRLTLGTAFLNAPQTNSNVLHRRVVFNDTCSTVASNGREVRGWFIGKDVEESGRTPPGRTEDNHEKSQSGQESLSRDLNPAASTYEPKVPICTEAPTHAGSWVTRGVPQDHRPIEEQLAPTSSRAVSA